MESRERSGRNGDGAFSSPSRLYADRSLKLGDLASADPAMVECLELARLAAPHDLEILIAGESGTGKNLLALAIHNEGPRRVGPFVALNTGAVPESLIESELFGHERGAFTGAHGERRGVFQMAHEGTLFLDEVGNMTSEMQMKLLTVVEHRRFRRVGGGEEQAVDCRLISATNADLREDIQKGAFRRDLYYRLCRLVIRIPPLRERKADILPLARRFLAEANDQYGCEVERFSPDCEERILAYSWPGNLRQLRSAVSGAAVRRRKVVEWRDFASSLEESPDILGKDSPPPQSFYPPVEASLDLVEGWHLERVLRHVEGNITAAAKLLGVSRRGLYDKLRRHGLGGTGVESAGLSS